MDDDRILRLMARYIHIGLYRLIRLHSHYIALTQCWQFLCGSVVLFGLNLLTLL